MHFPIIKLEPIDIPREDWDTDLGYEDVVLNVNTDYYGEMYSAQEREAVIKSKWLATLLDGIATLDTENETITFLDGDTIEYTLHNWLREVAEKFNDLLDQRELNFFDIREAGRRYKSYYTMFYMDYGLTSLNFVEDAIYHEGETWQIGNIFDAHF